jgi:hypothetical protein
MDLEILDDLYCIYKFRIGSKLPGWIYSSDFYSITATGDELSVVAARNDKVNDDVTRSCDWRIMKLSGPLDLSMIGVIADISDILKMRKISIFVISTYNTDYVLVRQKDLDEAVDVLKLKGYTFKGS